MADDLQTIRNISWRELFPFTHLFRSFRIAIHPSKLVLGLLLILSFYCGGRILDGVWPSSVKPHYGELSHYEDQQWRSKPTPAVAPDVDRENADFDSSGDTSIAGERLRLAYLHRLLGDGAGAPPVRHPDVVKGERVHGIFDEFFGYEIRQISDIIDAAVSGRWSGGLFGERQLVPSVVQGLSNFLIIGPGWLISNHLIFFLLLTTLFLVVWAIFGGAIARIAAVQVARDEKISVRQALTFSFSKVLSFVFAPVIPLGIILGLGLLLALGGLIHYLPWGSGPIISGLLMPLALIAGFIITLVSLGTLGGFNLMYPTVAVEGSDSFDAISRSFSYVFARPWRMVFYTAVALVYGGVCYLFVRFFIYVMLCVTHYFISWWLGGDFHTNFMHMWPSPDVRSLIYSPDWLQLAKAEAFAAGLICFWIYLTICLLGAFAISFYFSANTVVYFLMRREVDATELDDVYVEETEDDFADMAPLSAAGTEAAPEAPVPAAAVPVAPEPPAAALESAPPLGAPTPPPSEPTADTPPV